MPPAWIDNQTRALLLVKPPKAPQIPLAVSERQTQLIDLRATLWNLAFSEPSDDSGTSIFANKPSREVPLFMGYKQRTDDERDVFVGGPGHTGAIHDLTLSPDGTWTRHPDVPTLE